MQLPTDSLYKFMAIAGLVLIFGGIYFPSLRYFEAAKEQIILDARLSNHKRQLAHFENRLSEITTRMEVLKDSVDYLKTIEVGQLRTEMDSAAFQTVKTTVLALNQEDH